MSTHNKEFWQVEAEKQCGEAFVAVLVDMRDTQRDMVTRLDTIIKGFPDGDIEGHRRYHEAVIERIELRNELVKAAMLKMVQAGAFAAVGWMLVALWQAFKFSVTK